MPKFELNQLVHVHLYRQGSICRRVDYVDTIDNEVDALLERLARDLDTPPIPA